MIFLAIIFAGWCVYRYGVPWWRDREIQSAWRTSLGRFTPEVLREKRERFSQMVHEGGLVFYGSKHDMGAGKTATQIMAEQERMKVERENRDWVNEAEREIRERGRQR